MTDILENLTKTIDFIKLESPNSKIIILGSVPQWKPSLPIILIRENITLNRSNYIQLLSYKKLKNVDEKLSALANIKKVEFISILDNLCVNRKCLATTEYKSKFWPTAWDSGHLTEAGSVHLYTKMRELIHK